MAAKKVGDLQVDQDLAFQRWEWRLERAGWILLALVIVAAVLGLAGGYGPLRTATATAEDGQLRLEYDRFIRYRAPTQLRFLAPAELATAGELEIALTSAYADEIEISSISPEPDSVAKAGDRTLYTFKVEDGKPVTILFQIEVGRIGIVRGQAGSGALPLRFSQVVYP